MSLTQRVRLGNPAHRLPMPGQPGAFAPAAAPFEVPALDPFWAQALADGSVVRVEDSPPEPEPTPEPAPAQAGKSGKPGA